MRERKTPSSSTDSIEKESSSKMPSSDSKYPNNSLYNDRNREYRDEPDARENSALNPVTATILNTLSQDNLFLTCLVIVEILGFAITVLCCFWIGKLGGFGFDKPYFGLSDGNIIFNWHPFLMILGMIFLNANGILIYRSARTFRYKNQKLLHFGIQASAILISWIGFIAAFRSHTLKNIPHFYSLHSWLGLVALSGVTLSLVTSFLTYLYPRASSIYRKLSMPFHIFGGIANIALSAAICVAGLTEKAFIMNCNKQDQYSSLTSTGILLNSLGIVLTVFTILVVWMVTKPEFKRRTRPVHGGYHDKSYD